jgi:hypothetical protein
MVRNHESDLPPNGGCPDPLPSNRFQRLEKIKIKVEKVSRRPLEVTNEGFSWLRIFTQGNASRHRYTTLDQPWSLNPCVWPELS